MEEKPSGVAYFLARLKGLWAALFPLWELWQAVSSDQTITENELQQIVQALIFFAGVWVIPNLGYIRRLRDKAGQYVKQGVDDEVELDLPGKGSGRHEFVDTDQDGVSDAEELRANEGTRVYTSDQPQVHVRKWPQ